MTAPALRGRRLGPLMLDTWRDSDGDTRFTLLTLSLNIGRRSWAVSVQWSGPL